MKTKSKRKTDLKSSILILLLLAVLLIASTYAWFTSNRTVQVSELDVNVVAKNGLQISADASEWKSILQVADLTGVTYTGAANQIPTTGLEPVSTVGDVDTNGNLKLYYGSVSSTTGENLLTATAETDGTGYTNTGRYMAFDIYLKNDNATALPIYLTSSSNVIYKDAVSKGLENAARVAFITEGNGDAGTLAATAQAWKGGTVSKIWEPNSDTHTTAGLANGASLYGGDTANGKGTSTDGILAPISTGINLRETTAADNGTYFKTVTPAYKTTNGQTSSTEFMSLEPGVTKIRVYMWVEGQDIDCENTASGAALGFNLQFSLDAAGSTPEEEPEP